MLVCREGQRAARCGRITGIFQGGAGELLRICGTPLIFSFLTSNARWNAGLPAASFSATRIVSAIQ